MVSNFPDPSMSNGTKAKRRSFPLGTIVPDLYRVWDLYFEGTSAGEIPACDIRREISGIGLVHRYCPYIDSSFISCGALPILVVKHSSKLITRLQSVTFIISPYSTIMV